jgi:hypothetical protein
VIYLGRYNLYQANLAAEFSTPLISTGDILYGALDIGAVMGCNSIALSGGIPDRLYLPI